MTPSPRVVSTELLTRKTFTPATTLNLLAAAWLQFQIRDWFSHGKSPKDNPWQLPLGPNDPWPENPMTVLRTMPDPTRTSADDRQTRHPHQHRNPLVGRLPALRQHPGIPRQGPHPHRRQDQPRQGSPRPPRSRRPRSAPVRLPRRLVARPRALLHPLLPRAQQPSATSSNSTIPSGPTTISSSTRASSTPLSSPRSTPSSGPPPSSDTRRCRSACAPTGGASPANTSQPLRPPLQKRARQRHPRLRRRPVRRPLLPHRGVRRRLPHAPAHPRRHHLLVAPRRTASSRPSASSRSPATTPRPSATTSTSTTSSTPSAS